MVGAVVFTVSDLSKGSRMKRLSGGKIDLGDATAAMNELVAFLIGGMNAADLPASVSMELVKRQPASKQPQDRARPRRSPSSSGGGGR